MKIIRKFENIELTVNVTQEEITHYLSSLPLKERADLVKSLFEKDKSKLITSIREEFETLKLIIGL